MREKGGKKVERGCEKEERGLKENGGSERVWRGR